MKFQERSMKSVLYWLATGIIVAELFVGGVADLMRARWASEVMIHLGYPLYMMTILGFWKVLAAAALVFPRINRIREWAYAGTVFELTGAAASHLLRGDGLAVAIAPSVFTLLTLISWILWNVRIKEAGAHR